MPSFVLQIILLLFVIGGIIAYIGNFVGRYIGKRRLTLFNLRPRYTAIAITVISGILIALSTLIVVLLVSQDARTALLGLEQLKQEINQKSLELKEKLEQQKELENKLSFSRREIAQLQSAKQKLGREITAARKGDVLFKNGEIVAISLIQAGPEREKIEAGLNRILSGNKNLKMLPENLEEMVSFLSDKRGVYVVKVTATRNVLWGEEIPVRLEGEENKLIYKEGGEITDLDIPAGLAVSEIEQEITGLLKKVHGAARAAGVLPDPSGSLGSVPYAQIFELAKKIKTNAKKVNLKAIAGGDVYLIGPLEIKFKIGYR